MPERPAAEAFYDVWHLPSANLIFEARTASEVVAMLDKMAELEPGIDLNDEYGVQFTVGDHTEAMPLARLRRRAQEETRDV